MTYTQESGGIQIDISGLSLTKFPSTDVFVLKIEYAADQNVKLLMEIWKHSKLLGQPYWMIRSMNNDVQIIFYVVFCCLINQ